MSFKFTICVFAIILGIVSAITFSSTPQVFPDATSVPPEAVESYSANRTNRFMHNFFHNVRMSFPICDAIEQDQLDNLGWKPTYISYVYYSNMSSFYLHTANGEDFLYMHRQMVFDVNKVATENGSGWSVNGWSWCPLPSDPNWPVPEIGSNVEESEVAYYEGYKSESYYTEVIIPRQEWIEESSFSNLINVTLGEFGAILEYELHTDFHVRFSAYSALGYRLQNYAHPTAYIDTYWDNEEYQFLADFYSAHVNPTFWKIHGWVENMIGNWSVANGLANGLDVTWSSYWIGGPAQSIPQLWQVAADGAYRATHNQHTNAGIIVGSVIGGVVCGFIIALIGFYCMLKIHGKHSSNQAKSYNHEAKPLNVA